LTAIGEKSPIQRTGIEVRRLAEDALIPRSFRIVSKSGAIEEITGLKFKDAKNRAMAKSVERFITLSP
jgi:hypothetical protein